MRIDGGSYGECTGRQAREWARGAFGQCEVPDARLVKRCVRVASDWARWPGMPLGRASGDRGGAKAGYRFIENPDVRPEELEDSVCRDGARACRGEPVICIAQDTTWLSYGQRAPIEGLGPVTTSGAQGLLVHSSLAVRPDGLPLGLVDQQVWTREPGKKLSRKKRRIEDKESRKWLDGLRQSTDRLRGSGDDGASLVFVLDREADIYEVFALAKELKVGVVVRSSRDRRIREEEGHLDAMLRSQGCSGSYTLSVPRKKGHRPARTATMEVRYAQVTLKQGAESDGDGEPLELYGVLTSEVDPPEGLKAVEWRLVTTEPVESYEDAVRVVWLYSLRWRVEEFHLVLKSGCRMESHQFESADRIHKALAILSGVAVVLLRLTYLGRVRGDSQCTEVLSELEARVLAEVAATELGERVTGLPTLGQALQWIGRLGGHPGRSRDGPPGVRTVWRGWQAFQLILAGAKAALSLKACQ